MPAEVFVLFHTAPLDEHYSDSKIVGCYSSEARAEEAISRMVVLPGFVDTPDGFQIDAYPLDQDYWREGFETIVD